MSNISFDKTKNAVLEEGKKAIEGSNHVQTQMSSITKDQIEEIEARRAEYFSEMASIEDMLESDSRARIKMSEYAMDIYRAYLSDMNSKYLPIGGANTINAGNRIRYFDITKWVIDPEEKNIDKLVNVYQVLSQQDCSIALIYTRESEGCRVTLAVANIGVSDSPDIADQFIERIQKSIKGNFPGAEIKEGGVGSPLAAYELRDNEKFYYSIASVSNLASEKSENFISQSMEKLLDGIVPPKGLKYNLILLATPCKEIEKMKADLTLRYSQLSAFAQWQTNNAISEGKMLGAGSNIGANAGVNFGFSAGINIARNINDVAQISKNEGVTRTYTDYAVKHLLDTIEKQITRLEESDALGMWDFAAYAVSADPTIAEDVAHMYLALAQGTESYVSKSAINLWEGGLVAEKAPVVAILDDVCVLKHPEFVACSNKVEDFVYPLKKDLTITLSGKDLAKALNFPQHSVAGLPVVESVSFGREIYINDVKSDIDNPIDIGCIYHMHSSENKRVELDINSLCSHTFITGSTGKGKSNSVYKILEKVCTKKSNDKIHFMVVEPAKGEYKDAFYDHPSIKTRVVGTNPKETELLRINPFVFPNGVHVLEHVDRLAEIFNACWPMYAAMPAILKNAIIKSYESCGWDMTNSVNGELMYPKFSDVLEQIKRILNTSSFSDDNKGDYIGALCTRVESLTTGLNGMIFSSCDYLSDEELYNENVIVDLSRIGSPETKALIMSLLVMKLQEFRMCEKLGSNLPLRHLTVLEEAHNILKRTSTEQSADSSNVQGKAVEVISNAIAEMRTYGEGFIIADQAPGLLDISVIRNTNTKIVLCLPEEEDRQIAGRSIGLKDKQIAELAKLEKGVAAVYQNDWQEAVLCKFEQYHKDYSEEEKSNNYPKDKELYRYDKEIELKSESQAKKELLKYLLSGALKVDEPYSEELKTELLKNVEICGLKSKAHRDLDYVIKGSVPESLEDVAPYISYLYGSDVLLDNLTAKNMDEWNEQVLRRLDSSLCSMEECYQSALIRCLMIEQVRINDDFRPYEMKWVAYMKERR